MTFSNNLRSSTPSEWVVTANDGNTLLANNPSTGETFSGSPAAFRAKFAVSSSGVTFIRKDNRVAHRFGGGTGPSLGTQQLRTFILRLEAEAPYRRLRFHFLNAKTGGPTINPIKFAAAATDTLSEASTTLRCQPHVAGVPYSTLAADAGSPGWVPGSFNGVSSVAIPAAASTYRRGVLSSDWLDISSLPRTDVVNGRPGTLLRIYGDIEWTTMGNIATDASATVTAWRSNQSAPWYRIHDMSSYTGDGVADLTQNGGSISNVMVHLIVEYDYENPGVGVLGIGDSLTENSYERGKYAAWGHISCATVSSPSCPVMFQNCGHAGQTADVFDLPGLEMIALTKPSVIFHQAYSPNPSATEATAARIALSMSRLNRTIAAAKDYGSRVCVWSPLANDSWDSTDDAGRLALRQLMIKRASTGEIDLLDFEADLMTTAVPARVKPELKLDSTHPNALGLNIMAEKGAAYLRQFI